MCMRYDHKATLRMRKRGTFKAWKVVKVTVCGNLIAPSRGTTYRHGMSSARKTTFTPGPHQDGCSIEAWGFHVFLSLSAAKRWRIFNYEVVIPVTVKGSEVVAAGRQEYCGVASHAASFRRMRILKRDYERAMKGKGC